MIFGNARDNIYRSHDEDHGSGPGEKAAGQLEERPLLSVDGGSEGTGLGASFLAGRGSRKSGVGGCASGSDGQSEAGQVFGEARDPYI